MENKAQSDYYVRESTHSWATMDSEVTIATKTPSPLQINTLIHDIQYKQYFSTQPSFFPTPPHSFEPTAQPHRHLMC